MGRFAFFLSLVVALLLGFAIGAGLGWINGQNGRPERALVSSDPVVK